MAVRMKITSYHGPLPGAAARVVNSDPSDVVEEAPDRKIDISALIAARYDDHRAPQFSKRASELCENIMKGHASEIPKGYQESTPTPSTGSGKLNLWMALGFAVVSAHSLFETALAFRQCKSNFRVPHSYIAHFLFGSV
jgi:hypothetical protein